MNQQLFERFMGGKRVAILGFGQEGRSTFNRLRAYLPGLPIVICDQDAAIEAKNSHISHDPHTTWKTGEEYLTGLYDADIIVKSPGVPLKMLGKGSTEALITSQTELFVRLYRKQITGITGTKGKSTTSALLHHILETSGSHSLLLGNIGVPPFDMIDQIRPDTRIINEMSSHQLENIHVSPQYAVILNIFQEHLDHYPSYGHYQQAKLNITRWQTPSDSLIYNAANDLVSRLVEHTELQAAKLLLNKAAPGHDSAYFESDDLLIRKGGRHIRISGLISNPRLPGIHNLTNIAAAAALAISFNVSPKHLKQAVSSFGGLPHRLEPVGPFHGISFYNDSISTVPESTMAALQAIPQTTTLILGGYDRGIDYQELITFIARSAVQHIVFSGQAGRRMYEMAKGDAAYSRKKYIYAPGFDEAFRTAVNTMGKSGTCLLSPAAASYDEFGNYKERGQRFKQLAELWHSQKR